MKDKVYLVEVHTGSFDDSWWFVYYISEDIFEAEKAKMDLEKRIQNIKNEYENEFGRNYDEDQENVMDLYEEDRHEKFYTYQFKYPELGYHTIIIKEVKLNEKRLPI